MRREELARRSGLRGTQALLGGNGFVGFERGSLGGGTAAGGDRGPIAGGSSATGAVGTEAEFRRIMRSGSLGTMITGLQGMVNR